MSSSTSHDLVHRTSNRQDAFAGWTRSSALSEKRTSPLSPALCRGIRWTRAFMCLSLTWNFCVFPEHGWPLSDARFPWTCRGACSEYGVQTENTCERVHVRELFDKYSLAFLLAWYAVSHKASQVDSAHRPICEQCSTLSRAHRFCLPLSIVALNNPSWKGVRCAECLQSPSKTIYIDVIYVFNSYCTVCRGDHRFGVPLLRASLGCFVIEEYQIYRHRTYKCTAHHTQHIDKAVTCERTGEGWNGVPHRQFTLDADSG
jgi:hypothetical protein